MKNTIELLGNGFESSSGLTPEFLEFFKVFKREFKKELNSIKASNITFSRGHFYVSGFFTVNNQPYYFSLSDVRGMGNLGTLMYRTANDYKDYTGGQNMFVTIENGMAEKMNIIK